MSFTFRSSPDHRLSDELKNNCLLCVCKALIFNPTWGPATETNLSPSAPLAQGYGHSAYSGLGTPWSRGEWRCVILNPDVVPAGRMYAETACQDQVWAPHATKLQMVIYRNRTWHWSHYYSDALVMIGLNQVWIWSRNVTISAAHRCLQYWAGPVIQEWHFS